MMTLLTKHRLIVLNSLVYESEISVAMQYMYWYCIMTHQSWNNNGILCYYRDYYQTCKSLSISLTLNSGGARPFAHVWAGPRLTIGNTFTREFFPTRAVSSQLPVVPAYQRSVLPPSTDAAITRRKLCLFDRTIASCPQRYNAIQWTLGVRTSQQPIQLLIVQRKYSSMNWTALGTPQLMKHPHHQTPPLLLIKNPNQTRSTILVAACGIHSGSKCLRMQNFTRSFFVFLWS